MATEFLVDDELVRERVLVLDADRGLRLLTGGVVGLVMAIVMPDPAPSNSASSSLRDRFGASGLWLRGVAGLLSPWLL